jgi:hypothetical protein
VSPREALVPGAIVALALFASADAQAQPAPPSGFEWLPGAARAIARTDSASRDTPVFEYAYGPRAQASIGAEFGVFDARGSRLSGRFGVYGMVCLENGTSEEVFPPHELWRGLVGFSAALSSDWLARRWFGPGSRVEITLGAGHESDHEDDFRQTPGPRDIPFGGGGDFLAPDLAVRLPLGARADVTVRLQERVYVRGALAHAPGADLVLRVRPWPAVQPSLALFGEQIIADDAQARDTFFARALLSLGFTGTVGVLGPFASFDVGAGKGLLINRREARFSAGVRYAPF